MAEGILKKVLEENGIQNIRVESAGTFAPVGNPATTNAILCMIEHGIDISQHRARLLTQRLVDDADLVIVMERAHKIFVERLLPTVEDKVFLLKAIGEGGSGGEVEDPIGGVLEMYRRCRDELETEIRRILPDILRLRQDADDDDA